MKLDRIGEKFITNEGCKVEIINYKNSDNVDVKFEEGHIATVQYGHLKRGKVRNYNRISMFGVGFIGIGNYKTKNDNNTKHTKFYITWRNMLERSNSKTYKQKYPSYRNCSADERWYNFQNFAKWMEDNYNFDYMDNNWHLDKDILVKGNKIYSPATCCFVPNEINSFFVKGKSRRGNYLIGVSKNYGKFMVSCNVDKKVKNLGYFTTELEAFQVYKDFKEDLAKKLANK